MISSRSRSIVGTFSIFLVLFSLYLSFYISLRLVSDSPFHLNLMAAAISGFNVAILFAWIAFGMPAGVGVTVFSIIMVIWINLRAELYGYNLFTLSFVMAAFIGYGSSHVKSRLDRARSLKYEKLDEEINMLSNGIREKNNSIKALEEKLKRYSLLKDVVEALSAVLSLDDISRIIVEKTILTLGKPGRVLLFLVNVEKQELMLSASGGELKVMAKKGDSFDYWVLRQRKTLFIEDITKDFRFPADKIEESKELFRSLIAAPLISESKLIGILRMDSPEENAYTPDDLRLLDIIANLGAVAIQNSYLYSKTQELAIRDGLTGLVVRRYFMEEFRKELKRAARKKGELSLLIMDIDHFKEYNDKYGHTAGDLVLKHLSQQLTMLVKEGDVIARYGGEELALLLYGADRKEAAVQAELIRKTIKEKPLMLQRHETNTTVSIGVASYPDDAVSEEDLIRVADERLYKAKAQGRDRVCSG